MIRLCLPLLVALTLVAAPHGQTAATRASGAAVRTADSARDLAKATPESVGVSTERLRRLDAGLKRFVDEGRVAGVTSLLARHGKIVNANAFGRRTCRPGAAAARHDLPHLLDEQADHRRRDDDAVRGRQVAARRSRLALHPGVCQAAGPHRRQRRRHDEARGRAPQHDDARAADALGGPRLRAQSSQCRRSADHQGSRRSTRPRRCRR